MNFNPEKCSVLTITRKKNPVNAEYSIVGTKLKHYDHHPYLGVEIAQDLDCGEHIKATTTKAHRSLNLLRRNWSGCSRETNDKAFNNMVRPILEYAGAVWTPTSRTILTCWRRCSAKPLDLSAATTAGTPVYQVWCRRLAGGPCRRDAS